MPIPLQDSWEFPHAIDATMRRTFQACPQKFFKSFILNRAAPGANIHLRAGRAFAKALEVARLAYWNLEPAARNRDAQDYAFDLGARALIREYGPPDEQARLENTYKSLENMLLAFDEYWRVWGWTTDYLQPIDIGRGPGAEFSFAIPLPIEHPRTGDPLLYCGRLDMAAENRHDRSIWGVDEKTTKTLGPSWANQWHMRDQFIGYTWALRQHGLPCTGIEVRGLSIQATQIKTQPVPVAISEHLESLWYAQLLRDIERMIASYREGYFDYAFGEACSSYGSCMFRTVCQSPWPDRWLEVNTVERTWSPIEVEDLKDAAK